MPYKKCKEYKDLRGTEWVLLCMMHYDFLAIAKRSYESFGAVNYPHGDDHNGEQMQIFQIVQKVVQNYRSAGDPKKELVWFFFDRDNQIAQTGNYETGFIFTTRGIRAWYAAMHARDKWKLIPYDTIDAVVYCCDDGIEAMDIQYDDARQIRLYLAGMNDSKEFVAVIQAFLFGSSTK